jgi:adenylyltransferase/sulfurtransferase
MQFISVKDFQDDLINNNVFVLDVREIYEYEICKINSLNIPMGEIEKRIQEIPNDKPVVVLCKSGKRAEVVVNLLEREFNFKNLSVLSGGILAWIENIDNTLELY